MTRLLPLIGLIGGYLVNNDAVATVLPAAKYGADAYAGSYLLPPCGLSCAQLTVPGTQTDSSLSPGGFNSSMAQATLTGSPIPMVSAHANADNDAAVASAQIVYYMEVTGGSGASSVTLDVTASGFASASGGGATAGGGFEIQDSNSLAIVAAWTTCANIIYPAGCSGIPGAFNLQGTPLALHSNTLYAVNITASGSVGGCLSGPCALQTGDAQAFTDPSFMIDPSTPNLSLYSLAFSAGIGNTVPEPSTALLLSAGLMGLAVRRRHARGASLL